MEDNKKMLDLTDVSDSDFEQFSTAINGWKTSGEGMHLISDSLYDSNMAVERFKGINIGIIDTLATIGIVWAATKLYPKAVSAGRKIKEKFRRK